MKYISRIKSIIIAPVGEPIFSERATEVSIEDEAAGEFIKIRQYHEDKTEYPYVSFNDMEELNVVIEAAQCLQRAIDKGKPNA